MKKLFVVNEIVCLLAIFGLALSIYVPNDLDQTPKPYTTGLKIKVSHYKALSEPYYHSNYSKVYIHNKNYTSSLLDSSSSDSQSQATHIYPVYISEEKKEKIKNVLKEHNTNVVDKDTLNNRVVYKRRIEKSKNIEVFNKCPKGITGQFVYDVACNQYLDCWNGRGGPRNCAPGTLFNPKTLECDFPEKVECLTGLSGNSIALQRSAKLQSQEQAKCPEDFSGLIPNYTDCSKFIQCNNGIQTPRDCPPGTLFDTNLNVCNHERETSCFSGGPQRPTNDLKEEYGGSADISGLHFGKYTSQSSQYAGGNVWQSQGSQSSQSNLHLHGGKFRGQYGMQGQGQNSQANNLYGWQYTQTSDSQGTSGCDPTNPYCQSGGYVISGHNVYSMYPQSGGYSQNFGRDARYFPGTYQGTPCDPRSESCQNGAYSGQSTGSQGHGGTVYIQYVMCNPSVEDCTTFQQGTYMLGPGGALCNPINQQCGHKASYIPSNKMPSSSNAQSTAPSSGTYFVKYVMCNTLQQDCSQYQQGVIEAQYGIPGTLVGARPVTELECNPQVQNCVPASEGTTNIQYQGQQRPYVSSGRQVSGANGQPCNPQNQHCPGTTACNPQTQNCNFTIQYPTFSYSQVSGSHGKSGQPCNPLYQQCGPNYQAGNRLGTRPESQTPETNTQPCNPSYQDCSSVSPGYSVQHGQVYPGCNPQFQNCDTTEQQPSSSYGQISGSTSKTGQPCNPQYQQCLPGQSTTTFNSPGISPGNQVFGNNNQPCNPQVQPCFGVSSGQGSTECNPRIQNCHTSQYPHDSISGSHGKSGQSCNPLYQQCNPSTAQGTQIHQQGQNRPGISSYDQIHESQGSYRPTTTNFKTVCSAGDTNCYRNRPSSQGQGGEPKCPSGFSGITKHPNTCKKFLNCANGVTYIQECGPGTLFNAITNVCDFPYNVDCKENEEESITTTSYGQEADEFQTQVGVYDKIQGYPGCQGQACQVRSPLCQGSQCTQAQSHQNVPTSQNQGKFGNVQPGCQGANCGQDYSQGQYIFQGQGQYPRQGQDHYPSQRQNPSQGQGRYPGAKNECVGSQCTYHSSGQGHIQGGCQGSACAYNPVTPSTTPKPCECQQSQGHQGYTTPSSSIHGCQCVSNQGQRPIGGQEQDNGDNTNVYDATTVKSYSYPTRHQGRPTGHDESSHVMRIPKNPTYQGVQPINKGNRVTSGGFNNQRSVDYVDIFDPDESKNLAYATTTKRPLKKPEKQVWPPPFPDLATSDPNADYVFEYEDGEPVTLAPENIHVEKRKKTRCDANDFMCDKRSCVAKNFVCDGVRDCDDGKDEKYCQKYLDDFKPYKNSRLDVLEKQRWDNVTYTTCALLCMDTHKFECKSFNYRKVDKVCFLTNENIGSSGALKEYYPCDYYERKSTALDCSNMHKCPNGRCLTSDQICDGYDDCGDRADEKGCTAEDFGYSIKLAAGETPNEGRIEVTVFGKTGYICDDQFNLVDANVVCKELGFEFGAAEVKGNSFFAKDLKENHTLYMMDDIECFGDEKSIMHCNFAGWGIHNCADREIAGVVCKTPQESCTEGYWKCDTGNECVKLPFVCDGLDDCSDNSDEADHHCNAPTSLRLVNGTSEHEGRVEIRHNGIWGSICDDDFNEDAAKIVCNSLGFSGSVTVKKDGFFGESIGPIWLDQVSCKGNETSLEKCTHWDWGENNCDHSEDVGVVCSTYFSVEPKRNSKHFSGEASGSIKDLDESYSSPAPVSCGYRKDNIFLQSDDVHFRVVQGSVATPGEYPWQAALRIKGQDKTAHWCGAVVIASKWVLTAAHCLEGYPKGAYVVVAGEYNIDENEGTEQQAYIEEYYLHENFRKGHKMGNDIAMVLLKGQGFKLNQDIQPICLPDETADYERDLNCTISGFGTVQTGKSAYSHKLRAAWIPVQKMDVCKMAHIYGENIGDGMICAGDLTGGVDACDGDSGGPLACLDDGVFTLYGITSWGQRCGYANKPGVYVKVSHYKKWIEDIMKQHS